MANYFLTFDIEEWWGVHSLVPYMQKHPEEMTHDRLHESITIILSLLEESKTKATFFILGRVAEKYPEVVKKIVSEGHDIGTHGYDHKLIYWQTPQEFEEDLQKSIHILEAVTLQKIIKYRAPSYSINKRNLWALEILVRNGIEIDSSVMPSQNKRFGIQSAPVEPYRIVFPSGQQLLELPPTTFKVVGKRLPASSGFFFRTLPLWLIKKAIRSNVQNHSLAMIILHNWELDLEHPHVQAGLKPYLIHYFGLKRVIPKLSCLLKSFTFEPMKKIDTPKEIRFADL